MPAAAPLPLTVGGAPTLRGESAGEGAPVVLCHGLTATRRYVLHGSRALERAGHLAVAYDARGHGESGPAPAGEGYGYPQLVADLEKVVAAAVGERPFVLVGHSMGAHTAVAYGLRRPERLAGLVAIGPTYAGDVEEAGLANWDGLATALEQDGVDGFVAYIDRAQGFGPAWRDTVLRITRERMLLHRHPAATAAALRQVPRSAPFGSIDELESLGVPALVVASHDEADPGHPRRVAEEYAERLPRARLTGEKEGESPLAWQGGRLSREIAAFCAEGEVADRLRGPAT
jgi:pimeloyl-ACP methyl ester carboxylesterase